MSFGIVIGGGLGLFLLAVVLLGYFYPGSGADVLDWRPTRSIELEAQLEVDDLAQMLDAQNARRRRRGLPERSVQDIELQVAADHMQQRRLRAAYRCGREPTSAAQRDLEHLLAAVNERRRRRGQAPLSVEQYEAGLTAPGRAARSAVG